MRIKVGDEILDSFRDEIIAQSYSVNEFGDIVTRQGSFSNDFKLPLTAKNRRILGFPEDINSSSRNPYEKVSATLIDNATPIAPEGYLKYKRVPSGVLECAFFATNVEWFSLIKRKKLTDINLDEFDHDWTIANIYNAITADKESGYTYPVIDYGEFGSVGVSAFTINVDGNQMYPAMFVSTLVEKMFFDIGWKVEGGMIDHPLFKRMILPFSAKSFSNNAKFISSNKQSITLPNGDQIYEDTIGGIMDPWDYDVVVGLPNDTQINISSVGNYVINVFLNIQAHYVRAAGPDSNTIRPIVVLVNGSEVDAMDEIDVGFPGPDKTLAGQYNFETTQYLQSGDTVTIRVDGVMNDLTPGPQALFDLTVYEDDTLIIVQPAPEIAYGGNISMSGTLPDITQQDFLKYLVLLFGAIPQANNNSRTVNFGLFREIKNNIPNALDWSNKIEKSTDSEIDFTELLEKYSQVSLFTYKEDTNDNELAAYEAETGKRFGEGQFDIQNEHLASRSTIYEAPFAPTININSFSNSLYVPQIRFKGVGGEDDVEPFPKIAILSKNISLNDLTGGIVTLFNVNDPNSSDVLILSEIPFCWFAKTSYSNPVNLIKDSLVFDQVDFSNVIGEPIIDRFLVDFEDILNSFKYIKRNFHLTEKDIANLDFLTPIYVDEYKSYFYISKINAYQGSHKTTQCELVKISKSVEQLVELQAGVFIDSDLVSFIDIDGETFIDA